MTAVTSNLAERINAAHAAAHSAARSAIEHASGCGRLLLEAKAQLAHGEWLPWIEANLSFGSRQAQKYIRLHRYAAELPNATSDAHSTIDGALAALAEPKDPARGT